jgi:MFS family permease
MVALRPLDCTRTEAVLERRHAALHTAGMSGTEKRVMGPVFLTVLLDLIGFSVLFPLFPEILEHYLDREGPGSTIGRLHTWLTEIVGERSDAAFAVTTLFGGILGSLYSLLQFACAPLWGGLSDRVGRRRVLLFTIAGTAFAYGLWFVAGSFMLLVVSRLVAGMMAGNIATAAAVVTDVHRPENRARGMAVVGAAIGLGFVLGPAVGALSYHFVDVLAHFPKLEQFGVNPFSSAAFASLALSVLNWILVAARLPETLDRSRVMPRTGRLALGAVAKLRAPGLVRTHVVYFVYMVLFSALEFTLVFLTADRLSFEPAQNAWMFVFIGLVIALTQGGVVRRSAPRIGERRLATIGLVLLVPGFVLVGTVPGIHVSYSLWQLYGGLFLLAVGSATVMPCLSALASRYAPEQHQGLVQGTFRSMGSLARAVGPLLGGIVYWSVSSSAPYLFGAVLLALPLVLVARLPAPPSPAGAPGGPIARP